MRRVAHLRRHGLLGPSLNTKDPSLFITDLGRAVLAVRATPPFSARVDTNCVLEVKRYGEDVQLAPLQVYLRSTGQLYEDHPTFGPSF